jgi:creatinine amidohydrolase
MTDKYLFASMTWPEVNEAVKQRRVVLIPVGAIEQHGPHLPVDVDNVIATSVCETAAARAPDLLVCMPPVHYGFNDHNMDFPGTISIKMAHFVDYCFDLAASLVTQGFRRILLVNGHGSNGPLCELAARRVTNETEGLCASMNHWKIAWGTIAELLEGGPYAASHACEWETSEYLHLRPELVKRDEIRDEVAANRGGPSWLYASISAESPVRFMNYWSRMSESGVNGTPSFATAEKGKKMVEATIASLLKIAREFRDMPDVPRVNYCVRPGPG